MLEVEIAMGAAPVPIYVSSTHFALRYEVPKFLPRGGHLCMAVLTISAQWIAKCYVLLATMQNESNPAEYVQLGKKLHLLMPRMLFGPLALRADQRFKMPSTRRP